MPLYDSFTVYDSPIPYRNIKIYPALVKDYIKFQYYSSCLLVDKNVIPDIKIISMTYLEYLYYETQNSEDKPYVFLLDRLLSIVLRDDNSFDDMESSVKRYILKDGKPEFTINGEVYTSKDVDIIREIICEQNLLELPDDTIQKEVRDSLEKAKEYKNKLNGTKSGSFEDYMVSLSIATGWTFETIYNLSIRKFSKSVQRIDNLIHYQIYLSASMSGMVEFKDKSFIKHWLSNLDEDKYLGVKTSVDDIEGKISMESAKK